MPVALEQTRDADKLNAWEARRAAHLALADATEGLERVRWATGPTKRLDQRANRLVDYPRQQRRAQERKEELAPFFSPKLEVALTKLQPGQGLFMHRGRYFVAELDERKIPYANYKTRYQALFGLSEGKAGS
jgi:hypothetical protein